MVNVGNLDRVLRFAVGLVLLIAVIIGIFDGLGAWKYALGAVGLVMLATAALRFCPAYTLFGIKT